MNTSDVSEGLWQTRDMSFCSSGRFTVTVG